MLFAASFVILLSAPSNEAVALPAIKAVDLVSFRANADKFIAKRYGALAAPGSPDGERLHAAVNDMLADPTFSTDPNAWLASKFGDRRPTRELRIPEDLLRGIVANYVTPEQRAQTFAGDNARLLTLLREILRDPAFISAPREYLHKKWGARGTTRELRLVEDPARQFFDVLLKERGL